MKSLQISKMTTFTSLLILILVSQINCNEDQQQQNPPPGPLKKLPVAIIDYSPISTVNNNKLDGGIAFEILEKFKTKYLTDQGFELDYTLISDTREFLKDDFIKKVHEGEYQLAVGFPIQVGQTISPLKDRNITEMKFYDSHLYILKPNLLQLLVLNVLKEMFFFVFVIFFPWFLVNITIFYLVELKKFQKYDFFRGYWEAFKSILAVQPYRKMSACSKVYAFIFYVLSILLGMLLMGDFIYVVSATLLRSSDENINQFIFSDNEFCSVSGDLLTIQYFSERVEMRNTVSNEVTCFEELRKFDVGGIFASDIKLKQFYKAKPEFNNRFDFIERTQIANDLHFLININIPNLETFKTELQFQIDNFDNEAFKKDSFEEPKFDRIVPSSIFSESVLLIYASMTITAFFLIFFLIVLLFKQRKRPSGRKFLKLTQTDKEKKRAQQSYLHKQKIQAMLKENFEMDPRSQNPHEDSVHRRNVNPSSQRNQLEYDMNHQNGVGMMGNGNGGGSHSHRGMNNGAASNGMNGYRNYIQGPPQQHRVTDLERQMEELRQRERNFGSGGGHINKNKTLSLSSAGKKKGNHGDDNAFKDIPELKFDGALSSVIKAEETDQTHHDLFDDKAPEGENDDRNRIRSTRQMDGVNDSP